ncbi:MAG TPA: thiol-disulfide oxidoreductase DCC family protein [Planctomycetota bacterium]
MKPADSRPLLLFDGVCNLCNATVRWVVARDRRQVLRFASLQSQAGGEALARAGVDPSITDSVVLIDADGAHVQSSAALRTAGLLGLPWSLLRGFALVPRPLRDFVYRLVARNRYRWFGRTEACARPGPALAERFLDATEPPPAVAPAHAAAPPAWLAQATRGDRLLRFAHRFALVYWLLYVLPFPITVIPGTDWLQSEWLQWRNETVRLFADLALGVRLSVFENGSGDTTANYVETLLRVVLALAAAGIWQLRSKRRAVSPRLADWSGVVLRLYLGAMLISYGLHKVVPLQMPPIGPDRLLQPFGDASPMGLVWTFLGASPGYEFFAGASELLAGLLVIWRRTATLGAMIAVGVLVNVAAFNFFYDVPVKLFSTHLIFLAVFVMLPDLVRIGSVLFFNLPAQPRVLRPFPVRRRWLRWAGGLATGLFLWAQAVGPALSLQDYAGQLNLAGPRSSLHGIWAVRSFVRAGVADREVADAERWSRLGLNDLGVATVLLADGHPKRFGLGIDREAGTIRFAEFDAVQPSGTLQFTEPAADRLRLAGELDGVPVEILLEKEAGAGPKLTARGFRWINEFPYNR